MEMSKKEKRLFLVRDCQSKLSANTANKYAYNS